MASRLVFQKSKRSHEITPILERVNLEVNLGTDVTLTVAARRRGAGMTTNSSESSDVWMSSSPSLSVCKTESVLSSGIRGECDSRTFASGIVGLELNP